MIWIGNEGKSMFNMDNKDQPLVYDVRGLAKALDVSVRHLWRMVSAGSIPQPLQIGKRLRRWPVEEIRTWLRAGSPDRVTWERMKKAGGKSDAV